MAPLRSPSPQMPNEGVLLRCAVDDGPWAEEVPPAPGRAPVTVSLSDADAHAHHAEPLRNLGYVVVTHPVPVRGVAVADFLVTTDTAHAHRDWYVALAKRADRAFDLRMGPVVASLAAVLGAHAGALWRAEPG